MPTRRRVLLGLGTGLLAPLAPLPALAQDPAALAANENPAIARWASGKFVYREGPQREIRGYEEWRLTVATDGSRTLNMWYSVFKDRLSTFAIYRLDKDFKPLSLYKTTWVADTLTVVDSRIAGLDIRTRVQVDEDTFRQDLTAKAPFSITVSPIAADALHFARYDRERGGVQPWLILGTVAAGAEDTDIGRRTETRRESVGMKVFADVTLELVGEEQVTVPAGTFMTDHFRMGEALDMWLYGPDRTLVKYQWHPNDYAYELVEYHAGP